MKINCSWQQIETKSRYLDLKHLIVIIHNGALWSNVVASEQKPSFNAHQSVDHLHIILMIDDKKYSLQKVENEDITLDLLYGDNFDSFFTNNSSEIDYPFTAITENLKRKWFRCMY